MVNMFTIFLPKMHSLRMLLSIMTVRSTFIDSGIFYDTSQSKRLMLPENLKISEKVEEKLKLWFVEKVPKINNCSFNVFSKF